MISQETRPAYKTLYSFIPTEENKVISGPGLGYVEGELLVRFAPKSNGAQRNLEEKNQILSSMGEAWEKLQ